MIAKIQSETDKPKRKALIAEASKLYIDDIGHLALHQQALAWGVGKRVVWCNWPTTSCLLNG